MKERYDKKIEIVIGRFDYSCRRQRTSIDRTRARLFGIFAFLNIASLSRRTRLRVAYALFVKTRNVNLSRV